MRTYVDDKDGKAVEIGYTEILSRCNLERCANCQSHLDVSDVIPLHNQSLVLLKGSGQNLDELNVQIFIQTHDDIWLPKLQPKPGEIRWSDFERPAV